MVNIIAIIILCLIVGCASMYIWKEKKKGRRCIGCPSGGSCCSGNCSTNSGEGCSCGTENNT